MGSAYVFPSNDPAKPLSNMALAHVVSNKVEAAYRRGDLFKKRSRLMQDWSNYCYAPHRSTADTQDTIIGIRQASP